MRLNKQKLGLVLGPTLFIIVFFFTSPQGMSEAARAVLASTLWIATWWITEAIRPSASSRARRGETTGPSL
jgi:sodium-dependent dicarboxylate transporter 2/3/5